MTTETQQPAVGAQVDLPVRPLVERLRDGTFYGVQALMNEAADEIERLKSHAVTLANTERLVQQLKTESLRDALAKVLDTSDRYAKATMSYQNATENFSDSTYERKAHERAMLAASDAEREARVLLRTLRDGA